jgi:regulator of sirC expression with transglutaminase-like and TPR domain
MTPLERRFQELAARPDDTIDPVEGALLIAAQEQPERDAHRCREELRRWGAEVADRLAPISCELARLDALCRFAFGDKGLRGDQETYRQPANCFLDRVIERRRGIPITLALVLMELGRRAGVPLLGVGFPGHFLVRHGCHPELIVDPFHGGMLLTMAECEGLLHRISRGRIAFSRDLLRPVSPRHILFRILNNLKGIYLSQADPERALSVLDRMLVLYPGHPHQTRDRGLLLLRTGRVADGIRDLETYLEAVPEAPDWDDLAETLEQARESEGIH